MLYPTSVVALVALLVEHSLDCRFSVVSQPPKAAECWCSFFLCCDLIVDTCISGRRVIVMMLTLCCLQELSEAVEECWERNHGRLCHGADWDVLPTIQDAKVGFLSLAP